MGKRARLQPCEHASGAPGIYWISRTPHEVVDADEFEEVHALGSRIEDVASRRPARECMPARPTAWDRIKPPVASAGASSTTA